MMKLLEGKTAIVTGAARGIGRAIAITFAREGANVAFSDLMLDENTNAVEKELIAMGVKAKAYASNAASFESSQERMTEADWDAVITVNLKSVFNMTKAVQRVMLKQRSGSIINMSSVVGIEGNAGQSNYSSSKAGLIGFTKSIAMELGSRSIRVNAVAPGFISTPMTAKLPEDVRKGWVQSIPLRREGEPEDVADVCLFLASNLSSYVTGQVISVCGGMHT